MDKLSLKKNLSRFNSVYLFIGYFLLTFLIYLPYMVNHLIPVSIDGISRLNVFSYSNMALNDGEFPFWNDLANAGRPYLADFSNELFYPGRVIFSWMSPFWFFYCYYAFHLAWGPTFFYKLLDELKCSKVVAIGFSFAYYFSVYMGGERKAHVLLIACMSWLPAIFYFITKFIHTFQRRYLYAASIVMACQFLIEYPQLVVYTDILIGIYFVCMLFLYKRNFLKSIVDLVSWVSLYFGLVMIKVIPYALYASYLKEDLETDISVDYLKFLSTRPEQLFRLLNPNTLPSWLPDRINPELGSELFFGSISISLIIIGLTYIKKSKAFGVVLLLLSGTLCYTVATSFHRLAEIIIKIPLLKEFRCSSRIYFAIEFLGMLLAALGADQLFKNKNYKRFIAILVGNLAVLGCATVLLHQKFGNPEVTTVKSSVLGIRSAILLFVVAIIAIVLVIKNKKFEKFAAAILAVTIAFDLVPFWLVGLNYDIREFGVNTPDEEFIYSLQGDGKFLATQTVGNFMSVFGLNSYIPMRASSLTSYTNINSTQFTVLFSDENLTRVQLNDSGRVAMLLNGKTVLMFDNDVLSALGIQYVIDETHLLDDVACALDVSAEAETVFELDEFTTDADGIFVYPLTIEPDSYYRISFECDEYTEAAPMFWDFYGGDTYDNGHQQKAITLTREDGTYTYYICSENADEANSPTCFRLLINGLDREITLRNIKIERMHSEESPYRLIYSCDHFNIYENTNCKDIIYTPSYVGPIESNMLALHNKLYYDYDDTSYIVGGRELIPADTSITNIDHRHNSTSATVTASGETFVNFSQTFDYGWKAYIDGVETPVYKVNGYIQGIYVPAGTHQVEFKYVPKGFVPALIIEIFTIVITIAGYALVFINDRKKTKATDKKA